MSSWNLKKMAEKKILQFDVTFALYMLTPMEKFSVCMSSPSPFSFLLIRRSFSKSIHFWPDGFNSLLTAPFWVNDVEWPNSGNPADKT